MAFGNFYDAKKRCLSAPADKPVAVFLTNQAGLYQTAFGDTLGTLLRARAEPEKFLGLFSELDDPKDVSYVLTHGKRRDDPAPAVQRKDWADILLSFAQRNERGEVADNGVAVDGRD